MAVAEAWIPFSWHCSNCGAMVTGYKNRDGDIKVQCRQCHAVMIRRLKTKTHDTIDLYALKGQERKTV